MYKWRAEMQYNWIYKEENHFEKGDELSTREKEREKL